MPQDKKENISLIIRTAFFLLLSVQIVIGCIWGVLNFPYLSWHADTVDLLKLSSNLHPYSDTGILYPALLILVRALTAEGPVAFWHVMYLLQIAAAFYAWYFFAGKVLGIGSRLWKTWFSLAVITSPLILPVHMAVLEYSFCSSALCFLLTLQIRFSAEWLHGNRTGTEKALGDISVVSLFWLMLSLLRNEFIFLGAIPVVSLLVIILMKLKAAKKMQKVFPAVLTLVFLAIILLSDSLFRDHAFLSPLDNIKRGVYYRVAWSWELDTESNWPAHATLISDDDSRYSMFHAVKNDPGLVRTDFTDYVEECLGVKETSNAFLSWGLEIFGKNKKNIVKNTLCDLAGYVFPPLQNENLLRRRGMSGFATSNYDVMKREYPGLSKVYLRMTSVVYILMFLYSISFVFSKIRKNSQVLIPGIIMIISEAFIYTMYGDNVWDSRKALFVTGIWISVFACMALKAFKKEAA